MIYNKILIVISNWFNIPLVYLHFSFQTIIVIELLFHICFHWDYFLADSEGLIFWIICFIKMTWSQWVIWFWILIVFFVKILGLRNSWLNYLNASFFRIRWIFNLCNNIRISISYKAHIFTKSFRRQMLTFLIIE